MNHSAGVRLLLTKDELEGLFTEPGRLALDEGRIVEIAVYGGAV